MRNAVAFANNDVVTIAWSYGERPDGCIGFEVSRIDAQEKETPLPSHAVFTGQKIGPGQTTKDFPIQKFYWKDPYARVVADKTSVQFREPGPCPRSSSRVRFCRPFFEPFYANGHIINGLFEFSSKKSVLTDYKGRFPSLPTALLLPRFGGAQAGLWLPTAKLIGCPFACESRIRTTRERVKRGRKNIEIG